MKIVARAAVQVALAAALSMPLPAQPAPPVAAAQIISLVEAGTPRSDPKLSATVRQLMDEAPTPASPVSFAESAGTWRVVSAPLIDTISTVAHTHRAGGARVVTRQNPSQMLSSSTDHP